MPDLYGNFGTGPVYGAADPNDQIAAAFDMPMNLGATFWDQAKGGALESFGLGTEIRRVQTPEGNLQALSPAERLQRQEEGIPNPLRALRGLGQTLGVLSDEPSDTSAPLSQEQWKASPFYRESVPYDAAMTEARAEALAQWNDAAKVREYFATKRPITSFLGNIAGQAVDPINYIPIAGAIVKEASILRTALSGAGDAAANTAMFGIASRDARARYGDDVSWQATVSEIATAALIGGAFGAAAGALDNVLSSRASARAQRDLQTLKTTQEARIALNEAIDAVAHGEPIRLSPSAFEATQQRLAGKAIDPTTGIDIASTPPANLRAVEAYHGTLADFERFDPKFLGAETEEGSARQAFFFSSDPRVSEGYAVADDPYQKLDKVLPRWMARVNKSLNEALFKTFTGRGLIREGQVLRTHLRLENSKTIDMGGRSIPENEVADELASAKLEGYDSVIFKNMRDPGYTDASDIPSDVYAVFDPKSIDIVSRHKDAASANAARAKQPVVPEQAEPIIAREPGMVEAETRVGKSEDFKALASQHSVDPNTGDFPEVAEVEQLRLEGRLTDDDLAELADAEVTMQDADAYAEAFKAVTRCLL